MKRLFAVWLILIASIGFAEGPKPDPNVVMANRTLQIAGLPVLPAKAKEMQCFAWTGLSAGIYATWLFKSAGDFNAYVAQFGGMETASPIPWALLPPPNVAAPWFAPDGIPNGQVWSRGRISGAAPELFRLYADPDNGRLYLFYSWNSKSTYP